MYPHRIRLHGPWEFEPLASTIMHPDGVIEERPGLLPAPGRMKVPTAWSRTPLAGFRGRVRFQRRFHAPRSLEPHERLWLVFHGIDYFAEVHLNDTLLGRHEGYFDRFEFEITSLVRGHNELVVYVSCPAELNVARPGMLRAGLESIDPTFVAGIWRDVVVEVRSFAWLRDVIVHATRRGAVGHVVASGLVCGESDLSVELDLNVNGASVGRTRVGVVQQGTPFTIEATVDDVAPWWPWGLGEAVLCKAQLELHGGARTLDSVECCIGFRDLTLDPERPVVNINGREIPLKIAALDFPADPLIQNTRLLSGIDPGMEGPGSVRAFRLTGRVVDPGVYDWADTFGFLLLQDLPWNVGTLPRELPAQSLISSRGAGGEGPGVRTVSREREIIRQAEAMVRLLSHHPSVVLPDLFGLGSGLQISILPEKVQHSA